MSLSINLAENGLVPDSILRLAMRKLMASRLHAEARRDRAKWLEQMSNGPLALSTSDANEQHYEVPSEFFEACLGEHLKYSCCYWPEGVATLDQAEAEMLELSCSRAQLKDGQEILELGCGWGSLSLWMARHYPKSNIVSVSNSATQKAHIDQVAQTENLHNLTVITCDMNDFQTRQRFDRVVSIEMFEHMRNYALLLQRVSEWLKDDGKAFVHVFCHKTFCYPFENNNKNDWMARHFFTGGLMPSFSLFDDFKQHLQLEKRWQVNGTHYEKTSNAWLRKLDQNRDVVHAIFDSSPSNDSSKIQLQRWRMFYMACAELFGYNNGDEWFVGHFRFSKS
ncbi:MAG: cyclopropane-fatty-acyl-phospholipid synthase family protein [Pseudomonadota bacterium]